MSWLEEQLKAASDDKSVGALILVMSWPWKSAREWHRAMPTINKYGEQDVRYLEEESMAVQAEKRRLVQLI